MFFIQSNLHYNLLNPIIFQDLDLDLFQLHSQWMMSIAEELRQDFNHAGIALLTIVGQEKELVFVVSQVRN